MKKILISLAVFAVFANAEIIDINKTIKKYEEVNKRLDSCSRCSEKDYELFIRLSNEIIDYYRYYYKWGR